MSITNARCKDPKFPIGVTVRNDSTGIVKSIDAEWGIYLPGNSENLVTSLEHYWTWTGIVRPGESIYNCYAMPRLTTDTSKKALTVNTTKSIVTFYAPGEFVPTN